MWTAQFGQEPTFTVVGFGGANLSLPDQHVDLRIYGRRTTHHPCGILGGQRNCSDIARRVASLRRNRS